jgi:tetratricopeptide (TPR) repeat protein
MFGRAFLPAALSLALALPCGAQQAEKRMILEKYGPSVVAIRNEEGYGSGLVLDEKGTILTNAHVIVSPLPMTVWAMVSRDNRMQEAGFQKVALIGVDPTRDLALIRIDPSENGGRLLPLPISKDPVKTGDLIHAIGFPSKHGGQVKVVTTGEVTGLNRFVDMPGYFEFSAEVHPGNSGGPICTPQGAAVGVVTAGMVNGEPIAWAIPLHDLRPDRFVPLDRRAKNPAKAAAYLRYAETLLKQAEKGNPVAAALAGDFFMLALTEDISNPDIYFKIGMIQRNTRRARSAAAYLIRSLQLQPWCDAKDEPYSELGIALCELGKTQEAIDVWNEGLAKFPSDAGRTWDDLAVYHFDGARFLEAACATRASNRTSAPRAQHMNDLYQQCRKRLDRGGLSKLAAYENDLTEAIRRAQKESDLARQGSKRFLTSRGAEVISSFGGVQGEAANFDFSTLGKGPNTPKDTPFTDTERVSLFIIGRVGVAREFLKMDKIEKAVEILEDLIQTYPEHPETANARLYLSVIRKNRK